MVQRIFTRNVHNPLIKPADLPIHTDGVLNPGVVEVGGEVLLLLRIEDRNGVSHIRVARSRNGVDGWRIADAPLLAPDVQENPFEEWGCEDPRVTQISSKEWIVAYTASSRYGPAIALARTRDFVSVTRTGIIMPPTNKDATLFSEKIQGSWLLLHRPVTGWQEHIWYVSSPYADFKSWEQPGILLPQRGGPWWDGVRIGVGAPPIKTDDGWLLLFHGVKEMANRPVYRLGAALLDRENPRIVLARASEWVFAPEAEYEQRGLVPNVVFTCGALLRGDEVWMYYGAADTVIGLATAKLADLVDFVHEYDFLHHVGREKGMKQ